MILGLVIGIGCIYLLWRERPVERRVERRIEQPVYIDASHEGGDDRFSRAPKPERHWITQPDLPTSGEIYGKLPRTPTRGIPEKYQSMGVIKVDDGQILPLYGRRTAAV